MASASGARRVDRFQAAAEQTQTTEMSRPTGHTGRRARESPAPRDIYTPAALYWTLESKAIRTATWRGAPREMPAAEALMATFLVLARSTTRTRAVAAAGMAERAAKEETPGPLRTPPVDWVAGYSRMPPMQS